MENQSPIKKYLPKVILVVVLVAGAFLGYSKYKYAQTHEDTDNAQVETYFVPVLPRMAGYVKSVSVKDYDNVQKDQLLVEIDTDEAKLALDEMEADLVQAQTDVENAKANIQNLQLVIRSNEANLKASILRRDKAKKDADRDAALVADHAITRKQSDDTKSAYEVLAAQYEAGVSDLTASKSRLPILTSILHKAEASLTIKKVKIDQQKLKLSYAKVYAPASGKIGRKNVEVGQFIQASQPLMTIVKDSTFWVIANFKETQVEHLKIGDVAELKLDAYPEIKLEGKIASIAEATGAKSSLLPPDNASGNFVKVTQRVPVKIEIIDFQKHLDILRAGLSLEVSVELKK
ncbi:membrane fusion protein, multidrug efflux system [Pseudarcicella hirudinis]|uniref:Membrane fusion protein, multidrug efflux system n=1 Tax=Pseudarcicella hirudinis TaxID=1079859 RepID=A0A1I5RDR4_9BACT|nr:HlyD family secretion protein [Pseudarcicella hirudinis]SFP56530.1 membrane fusion protein, multidrug efflux system [Pseudarcicella hirudinis]